MMSEFGPFSFSCMIGFSTLLVITYIFSTKGIQYWIRYFKAIVRLRSYDKKFPRRLPHYHNRKDKTTFAYDIGIVPSNSEYEFENPQLKSFKLGDGIQFNGTDCDSNWLDVCINKIGENLATVYVFLKLSDEQVYRLPGLPDTRRCYIENEHSFCSSGLQIKCLTPFRKWRISFNGLLEEFSGVDCEKQPELVHVKFSFIWLAMSVPAQMNTDYNHKNLAKAFAHASCDVTDQDLERFYSVFNKVEQWGQMMGTLNIKGKDKDLYMWTCKTRMYDKPIWDENMSFTKLYLYFKEGYPVKIESTSIENFISKYTHEYSINGMGGYFEISHSNFNVDAMNENTEEINFNLKMKRRSKISIKCVGSHQTFFTGPKLQWKIVHKTLRAKLDNGDSGYGFLYIGKRSEVEAEFLHSVPLLLKDKGTQPSDQFVALLSDEECQSTAVAGGKGCSLALLTKLSQHSPEFQVPKGFVITTAAFQEHLHYNFPIDFAIKRLVDVSGGKISGDLKQECAQCMEEFQCGKLSDGLKRNIEDSLSLLYDSYENVRFSVRSSACGEDGEELSAAGQMLTVLGVSGMDNICDAIVRCWSSKFGFEAVQYARQNGQLIRSPMAVVVQEMVPSEVSGVLFTVDPVTGDPSFPHITANYGLGETVVSSLAEPDTFVLYRSHNNLLSLKEKVVGSKKIQIHMKEGDGTEETNLNSGASETCLSDEWIVKIGHAGLLVESCFCSPRDVEWALYKNTLYLLQARPITTLHTETDFELMHDQDTPSRSENEYWTRANTGEVFVGATSPMGISVVVCGLDISAHWNQVLQEKVPTRNFCPFHCHVLAITHRQVTISMIDTLYRRNNKTISASQKGFEVGLFGRIVGTEGMHQAGIKKHGYMPWYHEYLMYVLLLVFSGKLPKAIEENEAKLKEFRVPLETSAEKTFNGLLGQLLLYSEVYQLHGFATFLSSFYNVIILSSLGKNKKVWDSELYSDFASLLSTGASIESADVPESLQKLAKEIAKTYGTTFSSLPTDSAYSTLQNDQGEPGKLFKEFIHRHGHRCLREFDPCSTSWGMNPESLMPVLQSVASSPNVLDDKHKQEISCDAAISELQTPISFATKMVLKKILPWSRVAVAHREKTKSLIIRAIDGFRQTLLHLGKLMVEEGFLPRSDLVFYLTLDEVKQLMDTRKPGLVPRALRRKRLHSKLDQMQFPEIIKGIPRPVNEDEDDTVYGPSFTITGIPVCQGKVTAKARVVPSLSEANTIESGDILVTHSTDIGWTPYFPLLSGVVTVLGGLISHGAVVAREYGLPCVVGVQKAMTAFKSGDLIILDGTKGTITKIENEYIEL